MLARACHPAWQSDAGAHQCARRHVLVALLQQAAQLLRVYEAIAVQVCLEHASVRRAELRSELTLCLTYARAQGSTCLNRASQSSWV